MDQWGQIIELNVGGEKEKDFFFGNQEKHVQ